MSGDLLSEASLAVFTEVQEATPLWSFHARVRVGERWLEVGWPFTSWALGVWLECGLVEFVSRKTWDSPSLATPAWAARLTPLDGRGIGMLTSGDAHDLARDFTRWRDAVDGAVEPLVAPSAPQEPAGWVRCLTSRQEWAPPIGPDPVSRAELKAQRQEQTGVDRWFIFPSKDDQ